MGAVFEARHLRLDRPVAIKVLRPAFVGHQEYIHRFLREAKSASKIRHRNVVEILDYGEADGGLIYSVMEFLRGQDIDALLKSQPEQRLSWRRTRDLLVQVVSGLKAAHACGVIHRDIKPANCFVTTEEDQPLVKLVDFGIARVEDGDQERPLTATAQMIGTPSYIAPELIRAQNRANARSDIYSVGVLAYKMLTGRTPFTGASVFDLFQQSCYAPVPSLREELPGLPVGVERLVLDLLAKDPAERPKDMEVTRERLLALDDAEQGVVPKPIAVSGSGELREEVADDETTERRVEPRECSATALLKGEVEDGLADRPSVALAPTVRLEDDPVSGEGEVVVGGETVVVESSLGSNRSGSSRGWIAVGVVALLLAGFAVWMPSTKATDVVHAAGPLARPDGFAAQAGPSPDVNSPVASMSPSAERAERTDSLPQATPRIEEPVTQEPAPSLGDPESSSEDGELPTPPSPPTDRAPIESPQPVEESSPTRPRSRSEAKVRRRPSDSRVRNSLVRKIGKKCGGLMEEESLKVQYTVLPDGSVGGPRAPRNAAGTCAVEIVKQASFRERSARELQDVTVSR